VGPLYQLAGDLDAALEAYDHYAENYPDDWDGPHHRFCWGLALFHDDQPKGALRRWREAIFQNVYIAPLLLDEPVPDTDVWHGIDVGEPFYAEAYLDRFGSLWDEAPRAALGALWHFTDVQEDVEAWIDAGRRLNEIAEEARDGDEDAQREWRRLMKRQQDIETRSLSSKAFRRLLKQMP
jgi:tetratricopeptide (TPR) repeat protein